MFDLVYNAKSELWELRVKWNYDISNFKMKPIEKSESYD